MERYIKNIGTITKEEQQMLHNKKVLVIGAGGLGGFVIEGIARMGIKTIGICDFDVFDETNLNRQLLSLQSTLNKKKQLVAKERIKDIDNTIEVITYEEAFPNDKIICDIEMYDLVIDCLDNIKSRIQLEKTCLLYNKICIYGAVGGFYGTVGVISKQNKIIEKITKNGTDESNSAEKQLGNPFAIVGIVSSLQVYLATLVLLNKKYLKTGMYYIDIKNFSIEEILF